MARDYRAEYAARKARAAELAAAGLDPREASRIARGHARAGEPTAAEIRAAQKRTGGAAGAEAVRLEQERTRLARLGIDKLGKTTEVGVYQGGVFIDTNSGGDALRLLGSLWLRV